MMNLPIKIFFFCPVPEDQKPIQEYVVLRNNKLLNWLTLKNVQNNLFLFFWLLTLFALLSPLGNREGLKDLSLLFPSFLLSFVGILFRWSQLKKHLNESRLFYEEASWYDGQIWEKELSIIRNDRLLSTQEIEPRTKALWKFFSSLTFLLFFSVNFSIIIKNTTIPLAG